MSPPKFAKKAVRLETEPENPAAVLRALIDEFREHHEAAMHAVLEDMREENTRLRKENDTFRKRLQEMKAFGHAIRSDAVRKVVS
jgi:regulator of replication initiation timing